MIKPIICAILVILLTYTGGICAVNIPITVSESNPSGVSGISVSSEPVTVGVPLPEDSGITTISQLGLSGATAGQFRVLKRHPNNAIWWVLVDTQASVPADGTSTVTLTNGSGNFGGENLASETASAITVNTGTATFTINKTNFNLLDQVVIGGTTIVQSGNSGELLVTTGGVTYSSANSAATVTLEENGPVRAVIKATGRLTSSGAVHNGGYTLRMHFYKNKSFARYDTEISNSYLDYSATWAMTEAKIKQPTTLTGTLSYNFGYNDTTSTGTVSTSAWAYQANYGQYGDRAPVADIGIKMGDDGTTTHSLGTPTDLLRGYGIVNTTGKSVAVGVSQMKINEPAGFEFFTNGVVDVSLVSNKVSSGVTLKAGQHMMNIMYIDFSETAHDAGTVEHRTQYPLVGRCSLATYNAAGGIYGIDLVEVQEERDFFTANGKTFPEANIANTLREHVNRNYGWASAGTPNSDWNLKYLIDFLRTGNGALYSSSIQGSINSAITATLRSDNFNYFTEPTVYTQGATDWGRIYDEEHTFWEGQAYLYLVSGNEFIKDSMVDFGEYWERWIKATEYRTFYSLSYPRNWTRSYRNMAILGWTLESSYYIGIVNTMTNLLFKTPDTDAVHRVGVNYERGYIRPANGIDSEFMTSKLFPETLKTVAFCMGNTWPSVERFNDLIAGLARFVLGEFYGESGSSCGEYGYVYKYNIDVVNTDFMRSMQSEVVLAHGYYQTGNTAYLDRAKKVFFGCIECQWGVTTASELGAHALVKAANTSVNAGYVGAAGEGVVSIPANQVANNGNGTYTISWTVPSGSSGYQIKFAPQPMVDNLGFNQATRSYQYSPESYDNFWASLNVENEPSPVTAGQPQTLTVNVQQSIADYNSRYSLTGTDPGYIDFSGGTYYFAIAKQAAIPPSAIGRRYRYLSISGD